MKCRICVDKRIKKFLTFGNLPLPNGFIQRDNLKSSEKRYPLSLCLCLHCGLVQLGEIVNPERMFRNYVYIPSTSLTRMANFQELVESSKKYLSLRSRPLVVDIGSNDGSLLLYFKKEGVRTLGVDPATNLALLANLKGIETVSDFFSAKIARQIKKTHGQADVITATNVLAHINDVQGFLAAVELLLKDDGVFICEFPYVLDLIEKNQFDTIYHEHLSYFSLKPLLKLFSTTSLHIVDIKRTPIDGGSLRIYLGKYRRSTIADNAIKFLRKTEDEAQLHSMVTMERFAKRVQSLKTTIYKAVKSLKQQGKRVAGYGAAAKGNILLNYCKINNTLIDFIIDSTPYKQGLYTPGTHIPIIHEGELLKRMPDYTIILAWNFANEILKKEKKYRALGGKFIIPVPEVIIV